MLANMDPNSDFQLLTQAIVAYCEELVSAGQWGEVRALQSAARLKEVVKRVLPILAATFDDGAPDFIYAKEVMCFGVAGMNNPTLSSIWNAYFLAGGARYEIAYLSGNCF